MSEELKFNIEDLQFTEESDGVLVQVDEESDTYKILVALGKKENPNNTEQEAFESGLKQLIEAHNNDE